MRATPAQMRSGSPPRAWGGPPWAPPGSAGPRLTPTCVGRTLAPAACGSSGPAHPHVRGEDWRDVLDSTETPGSPPRAWGGPLGGDGFGRCQRLTPTCVGRTSGRGRRRLCATAHPHVRGEDGVLTEAEGRQFGSPPRAWGGRIPGLIVPPRLRLTPTCVGRTGESPRIVREGSAHPHVRGEDSTPRPRPRGPSGSRPRAWGGHRRQALRRRLRRLTPTCVGRTLDEGVGLDSPRLTPTCVGRTACDHATGEHLEAHPHVRGEDATGVSADGMWRGSPPRAWGGLVCLAGCEA